MRLKDCIKDMDPQDIVTVIDGRVVTVFEGKAKEFTGKDNLSADREVETVDISQTGERLIKIKE